MKKILILILFYLLMHSSFAQNLRVITFNVWSGLDYRGNIKMNEYEKEEIRKKRFKLLIEELKKLKPDVIFLQELNPVKEKSEIIAEKLGYDEIHLTINSGFKLFGLGIPSNLNEGIAIFTKKKYNLQLHNVKKLYGSTGAHGDFFSFQIDEANFMLTGKIIVNNTPVFLANTHLLSSADLQAKTVEKLDSLLQTEIIDSLQYAQIVETIKSKTERRIEEAEDIIDYFEDISKYSPVIIGGDFNTDKDSPELALFNENGYKGKDIAYTWNTANKNIRLQDSLDNVLTDKYDIDEIENTLSNDVNRQLDYILVNKKFKTDDIIRTVLVFTNEIDKIQLSDHYGISSEINLINAIDSSIKEYTYFTGTNKKSINPLPIVSYDTDVGLGLGGKCFFLNQLGINESFDVILFGSTLGERWGRFVFSLPDFELRQGKTYPLALDLVIDYDVYLKNRFYGIGSNSKSEDLENYTKEPLISSLIFSNGISQTFVTQAGISYATITNKNFQDTSNLEDLGGLNTGNVHYASISASLSYDSRNSYIKPSKGFLAKAEAEWAPNTQLSNVAFGRVSAQIQGFTTIFYPTAVFASRIIYSTLFGNNLPVQVLLPLGGNKTLRGFQQDRFLDVTTTTGNFELRLPLYWRFGLVVGADVGGVNHSHNFIPQKIVWNTVFGLRFDMDTYLVRLDVGFSKESMGFYLNFNHIF